MPRSSTGLTWDEYVAWLVAERGSLAAVALALSLEEGVDADAPSIERALRRLRKRDNHDGGQYGTWLLRAFGVPRDVEQRVKWMGVYHSRFTDLPVSICLDQLRIWARPPVSESRAREWIALGRTTCDLRTGDLAGALVHLEAARGGQGSVAARVESLLLGAYIASKTEDRARAGALLDEAEPPTRDADLEQDERACLRARLHDQRAYQLLHPGPGREPDLDAAEACLEQIPARGAPLFAACKRDAGLAYICHRRGDLERAVAHAEAASRSAGDGGFARLRVSCLGLLAHILGHGAGDEVKARAVKAARALEDEDLLFRLDRALTPADSRDGDRGERAGPGR